MGIFSLCEYAALNSRIHYVKSRMLKGGEWQTLLCTADLKTAVGDLGSLPMGEGLVTERGDGSLSLRMVEHSLQQNFITETLSHMRFLSGASAEALRELVRVYDLMNLKKVLRIKLGYEGKDRMSELFVDLYDLGRHSLLKMDKWRELTEGGKIGNAFVGTCYEEDFKLDIESAWESAGLLRLETIIERSYFKNLYACLKKSGGVELLRMQLDEFCLEQIVRLRYHFGMEIPAIQPLTMLDLSASFSEKLFIRLMEAEDERRFFELLGSEPAFKILTAPLWAPAKVDAPWENEGMRCDTQFRRAPLFEASYGALHAEAAGDQGRRLGLADQALPKRRQEGLARYAGS